MSREGDPMRLQKNELVTLGNGQKYVVMESAEIDQIVYYYMLRVNEAENDVLKEVAVMKEFFTDGQTLLARVIDSFELGRVSEILLEKFEQAKKE